MIGKVDDVCPFANKPANQCKPGEFPSEEHTRWHASQLVELGFVEIVDFDAEGDANLRMSMAHVTKLELYNLAVEVVHRQITPLEIVERIDQWLQREPGDVIDGT